MRKEVTEKNSSPTGDTFSVKLRIFCLIHLIMKTERLKCIVIIIFLFITLFFYSVVSELNNLEGKLS